MILLAVLVPVLRHERRASLPKGFLGVALSFALLTLGVVIVYIVSADGILALLAGELIGFLACWALLAVRCMGGSDWL